MYFAVLVFILTPFKLMALLSIGAFFVPTLYLKRLINNRFLNFAKQFPDALNLMASSLRAGHPLFSAIDIVIDEMPKPFLMFLKLRKKIYLLGRY